MSNLEIRAQSQDGTTTTLRLMDPESLCPDLLSLDYIGPADYMRGRVIRGFFRVMRVWPKPRGIRFRPHWRNHA